MKLNYNDEIAKVIEEKAKQSFSEMPVGQYEIRLDEVDNLQDERGFGLKFIVIGGEFKNRKIFKNVYLKSKEGDTSKEKTMLGMFAGFLDSCGISKTERHDLFGKDELNPQDLKSLFEGKSFKIQLSNRAYNGNTYGEIKKILEVRNDSKAF